MHVPVVASISYVCIGAIQSRVTNRLGGLGLGKTGWIGKGGLSAAPRWSLSMDRSIDRPTPCVWWASVSIKAKSLAAIRSNFAEMLKSTRPHHRPLAAPNLCNAFFCNGLLLLVSIERMHYIAQRALIVTHTSSVRASSTGSHAQRQ